MTKPSLCASNAGIMTGLRIIDYTPNLAQTFHDINAEWITAMFTLELHDRDVLENPDHFIISRGGTILFVAAEGLGVVGTCALTPASDGAWELTKMGVLASARGRKAGEFLLTAAIARAAAMPEVEELFLLTSHKCEAAIHLYEKAGFTHSPDIMVRFGAMYDRCDVAMVYDDPGRF